MLLHLYLQNVALWLQTTWSDGDSGGGFGSQNTFGSPLEDTSQLIGLPNGRERKDIAFFWVNPDIDTVPFYCELPGQWKAEHLQQVWG